MKSLSTEKPKKNKIKKLIKNFKKHTPWKIKKLAFSIKGAALSLGSISYFEKYDHLAVGILVTGIFCDFILNFFSEEKDEAD